ncbi:MAG: baseplate J/gp47 family protein [Clostridia bacterium]|nr:baseplate J/gp47 family protein [Clostridia bacterium]
MDNTELHYLTYDPDAIWEQMMLNYIEAGGDVLYPGDEKEMFLRAVMADIVQVFAGVDNALRMQTLRYAVGEYLDVLGEQRGCLRIKATAAHATVTITTNATGQSDVLQAGTAMTADGEVFYLLTEDLTLTGYAQSITVDVIADRTGSTGNGLLAGTQMGLAVTNAGVNSIVVATNATGGNEAEDDETYRERVREYGLASVSTGPQRQYETVAKAVSSVILDARALNAGAGSVAVYLILSTQTGAAALLQSVLDALSAEDVRPLTDSVSVYQATDVNYTLNVKYASDNSSATSAAIAQAVSDYQEWQDNTIGRAFNPDRLMAAIYQAGATRVIWDTGSNFDGGTVEYTEISSSARCKGTISLTAIST